MADGSLPEWKPNPGPQTRFLASTAYEGLYGGAAGGGKSEALLTGALRYVHVPSYRAILFRRTFPELERSLIERSHLYYGGIPGASYNEQKKVWAFESGAKILFGHLEHDKSVHEHQSAEYQYIGFDELTSFTRAQYVYMLSRARSSKGIPVRVRAATNPGGEGHEWVLERWAPWLDLSPEYAGVRVDPGRTLYYVNTSKREEWVPPGTPGSLSRVFIPAKLADNPKLAEADPGYEQRLRGLDPVTQAQLLGGDWMARPVAGAYFQRAWVRFRDLCPSKVVARVRYWDRASTEGDGDWTVGDRLSLTPQSLTVVEDQVRAQRGPGGVEALILATAEMDAAEFGDVLIGIEKDPGSAGVAEAESYVKLLKGFNVKVFPISGDKLTRFKPFSAQAFGGNVEIVRGEWNNGYIQRLEAFPTKGVPDDEADSTSGAYNALTPREKSGAERLKAQVKNLQRAAAAMRR